MTHASITLAPRRIIALVLASVAMATALAACGDEPYIAETAQPSTCGNASCDSNDCENRIRCPHDCGVCVGNECSAFVAGSGRCGEECTTSCDCAEDEFCGTAHGYAQHVCLPIKCNECSANQKCVFTVDDTTHCTGDSHCG